MYDNRTNHADTKQDKQKTEHSADGYRRDSATPTPPRRYTNRKERKKIMKIRVNAPLFVLGKSTQQGKKDQTQTYYYITCSQGEDEAGKIRVADADTFNSIEKYKQQLFTFEFNDQYNSFVIVGVDAMPTAAPAPDTGNTAATPDTGRTDTGKTDTDSAPDTGKSDKKR